MILLILVEFEVAWDWYHEVKIHKSPNYQGSNLIRLLVGLAFWIVLYFHLPADRWVLFPMMAFAVFWFLFDWSLNMARTVSGNYRPYWYLGDNSKLDKWQRANGGAFRWFWIKLLIAVISIALFQIGIFDIYRFVLKCFM